MKKYLLLACAALMIGALSLQSCMKVADQLAKGKSGDITFDTDTTFVINVPPITDTIIHIDGNSKEIDIDSFINANNTSGLTINLGVVDSFTIKECDMTILNPTTSDNFGAFQLSGLYFNTSVNTTQAEVGMVSNNPAGYASYLALPLAPTTNLKSYINDGKVTFNYFMWVKARSTTTTTLRIRCHITYDFHWIFS